jgi:bacterioferritin
MAKSVKKKKPVKPARRAEASRSARPSRTVAPPVIAEDYGPTDAERKAIVDLLCGAYAMELETVQNYLANSVNLDGVRAEEIKVALTADVTGEIGHAQQLANRIKQLGGRVPGSMVLPKGQTGLQPPADSTDVVSVIRGVIAAEDAALAQYRKVIRACEGKDYVTQDLAITLMADEEAHRIEFLGFLKEYTRA